MKIEPFKSLNIPIDKALVDSFFKEGSFTVRFRLNLTNLNLYFVKKIEFTNEDDQKTFLDVLNKLEAVLPQYHLELVKKDEYSLTIEAYKNLQEKVEIKLHQAATGDVKKK